MSDFVHLLKTKELKATPQRICVLKELEKKKHPTMEHLYEALRRENPSMSLATVYKNIATLKEKGVVIEVNISDGKMHYDIYSHPHVHLVCAKCGTIQDIDYDDALVAYQKSLERQKGIKIGKVDFIATIESCALCAK
jgi:Fur family transcriptional regulator, peroxide stress response regulator